MRNIPTNGQVVPLDTLCSRRRFCQVLGAGAATFALAELGGCGDMGGVARGGRRDPTDNPDASSDLAPASDLLQASADGLPQADDLAESPDLARGQACPPLVISTNMHPRAFAINTATFFAGSMMMVCRDAGGLFAETAICTHNGCTVNIVGGGAGGFACPCHGSRFDLTGAVARGPANAPLDHFALCLDDSGNVAFSPSTPVASGVRYPF